MAFTIRKIISVEPREILGIERVDYTAFCNRASKMAFVRLATFAPFICRKNIKA